METKYWKITIEPDNFFHNVHLHKHIKKNYYYFHSCLYGSMYISNIPSSSTYSFDIKRQKQVYENVPAPNSRGYKIFNLSNKSNENLTMFIKTNASVSNGKLKIKLPMELFKKIVLENKCETHNVFLLCKTPNGKYFVHASSVSITNLTSTIKKVDLNMSCDDVSLSNGCDIYE